MPGLGARLGRGGATTFLQDLANSDCVVIMGANMAENHPVGFRFVVEARERGATVIHIDPRFTRTSALADIHVPLRAGSDIVFLGGLINYVLEMGSDFREYVRHYTNATTIVSDEFQDTDEIAGLFSGYDSELRRYDITSWQPARDEHGAIQRDETLSHPNCVFQVVKRHFAPYTAEMVEASCGVPQALFRQVAESIVRNSNADRTTAFAYAVAWTQHTTGTQMISCCAILQLLLGNVGRPGGGIMALRGHATIQGSTDIPTLFNLLPGYLPMPDTGPGHETLAGYLQSVTRTAGQWSNAPAYMISLLKAFYGDAATGANDYAYDTLPRISGDYSFQSMILMMNDGIMKGLFCMGQNPAVGGQNARLARKGLASLDWLVVRDLFEIESAAFWKDAPEVETGETGASQIGTEVFLMPAAVTAEKEGSYTNTQRLVQWHDAAVDPPGDARSEAWFIHELYQRLMKLYEGDESPAARQLRSLAWGFEIGGAHDEPLAESVMREVNGYDTRTGDQVAGYDELASDGSTACGCWIYSGIMPAPGVNRAKSRIGDDRASLDWGFAWPANRRMLYNRASARPDGSPWSDRKKWIWWDESQAQWDGYDVPDWPVGKSPAWKPNGTGEGMDALPGDAPFIMMEDGLGQLFVHAGLVDGPLPTHYEPWESPVPNALHSETQRNPVAISHERDANTYHDVSDPRFPHVITTYRLTEHHTAGAMSRFVPWLAELQPEGFAEIDPQLAGSLALNTGDWLVVSTLRGEIECRALVTSRLQSLEVQGKTLHQVGIPWHFGFSGIAKGGIANDLSALVADPNSLIHEAKSFTCAVRKGRLPETSRRSPKDTADDSQ